MSKTSKHISAIILGLLAVTIFLIGIGFFVLHHAPAEAQQDSVAASTTPQERLSGSYAEIVAYWSDKISTLGGDAAYKEFAQQEQNDTDSHDKAHAFGAALYQVEGLPGIYTCDFRFEFGCYHEFVGHAIDDKGLTIAAPLDNICAGVKGYSACQHGIGHGLLEHEGYNLKGLKAALTDCDTYTKPFPYEGCYSGVFMEFNTRLMSAEGPSPHPVVDNEYTFPCTELDTKFTSVCAYTQPGWWAYLLHLQATPSDFARLGELCRSLHLGSDALLNCFRGVGIRAVGQESLVKSDVPLTALCDSAGSTEGQRLACRSMAAAYMLVTVGPKTASAPCLGLSGTAESYCLQYATGSIRFVYPQGLPPEFERAL